MPAQWRLISSTHWGPKTDTVTSAAAKRQYHTPERQFGEEYTWRAPLLKPYNQNLSRRDRRQRHRRNIIQNN